ncbi:MAG: DUF5662 family protein [Clostridia bacterium]|nr:DUF5662 family protein [Clostridia bacterium]
MNRFIGHLKTVLHHKKEVFKICKKLGIFWQGLVHDTSKFSYAEFSKGVKYFTDGHQSPNNGEKKEKGYSSSWLHHKGRNKHHFEYWIEFGAFETNYIKPAKMPLKYVKEMLADRIAATKTYLKNDYTETSPLEYYLSKDESVFMHPDTSKLLEKCLMFIAIYGEDYTFNYLKSLKEKDYISGDF